MEGVRSYIKESLAAGQGPAATARQIVGKVNPATGLREGGILGLTSQQMQWVANARAELADPATAGRFLARAVRDRRFDKTILAAIKAGKPLPKDAIDKIVGTYSSRLLKLRGQTIARTEGITALRAGQHEGHLQAAEKSGAQIEMRWQSTPDKYTRHSHMSMNGQKKMLGETFQTETGAKLAYPGDTSHGAPGKETINCRCIVIYKTKPPRR